MEKPRNTLKQRSDGYLELRVSTNTNEGNDKQEQGNAKRLMREKRKKRRVTTRVEKKALLRVCKRILKAVERREGY